MSSRPTAGRRWLPISPPPDADSMLVPWWIPPLAALCIWIVHDIDRVLEDVRPFLVRAGFRVEDRRLVPPDSALDD